MDWPACSAPWLPPDRPIKIFRDVRAARRWLEDQSA
jgi:hypothetical protein